MQYLLITSCSRQSCRRSMQMRAITYAEFEQWLYLLIPESPNFYEKGSRARASQGSIQHGTCCCPLAFRWLRSKYPPTVCRSIISASLDLLTDFHYSWPLGPSNILKKYLQHPIALFFNKSPYHLPALVTSNSFSLILFNPLFHSIFIFFISPYFLHFASPSLIHNLFI